MIALNINSNTIAGNVVQTKKTNWLKFNSDSYLVAFIYGLGIIQTLFGFTQPLVNTFFVVAFLGATLILSTKDGIKLMPMVIVYFGYTYVEMKIVGGLTVYNSVLTNLYILILAFKAIIHYPRLILLKKYLFFLVFGCYVLLQRLSYIRITNAIIGLLTIFVVIVFLERIREDSSEMKAFITLFVITLASSYIYNWLYIDLIAIHDELNMWREVWRDYQFVGMRDPNNLSLQANFCLAYILFTNHFQNNRNRFLLIAFLVLTSIITISLSGILTTFALLFIKYLFVDIKKHVLPCFMIFCFILISIFSWHPIYESLLNSHNNTFQSLGQRMTNVVMYIQLGNYYQLTSTRTELWTAYMHNYYNRSFAEKLLGNPEITLREIKASHNGWVDLLIDNGIVGVVLFVLALLGIYSGKFKKEGYISILVSLIFMANIFMRSIDGLMFYLLSL